MADKKYECIREMPHHVSLKHRPMSLEARAAQFAPFAALVGYGDAVKETARLTDKRVELDEDAKAQLDYDFQTIMEHIKEKPLVHIVYFEEDEYKDGGKEVSITGNVNKINFIEKYLTLSSGEKISFDDIYYIRPESGLYWY